MIDGGRQKGREEDRLLQFLFFVCLDERLGTFLPVLLSWLFYTTLEEEGNHSERQPVRVEAKNIQRENVQRRLDLSLCFVYDCMASFVWDCLFCLLPSVCFVLLRVTLRWPRVHCWTRQAVRAAGWRLWVIVCLILELKPLGPTRTWDGEVKAPDTVTSDEPRLICKPTALARYLLQNCGSLAKSKLASWPRGDPHLQTASSQLCGQREDDMQFARDHLLLKDGGVVALDWAVGTRLVVRKRWKAPGCFTSTPPVLLLIPQSWGGMSPHLKMLCHQAMRQGFYVVVFHHRGTAGSPLTAVRLVEFGDPADLEQVGNTTPKTNEPAERSEGSITGKTSKASSDVYHWRVLNSRRDGMQL